MSLRSRLEAAEARLGRVLSGHEGITVLGGLKADASNDHATVGRTFIERLADETGDAFRARVLTATRAAKEHVIFGGLPPMRTDGDA
jgi:hypothetical protein